MRLGLTASENLADRPLADLDVDLAVIVAVESLAVDSLPVDSLVESLADKSLPVDRAEDLAVDVLDAGPDDAAE